MKLCCQVCIFNFITVINGDSCSPEFKVVILPRFIKSIQQELHVYIFAKVRRSLVNSFSYKCLTVVWRF